MVLVHSRDVFSFRVIDSWPELFDLRTNMHQTNY